MHCQMLTAKPLARPHITDQSRGEDYDTGWPMSDMFKSLRGSVGTRRFPNRREFSCHRRVPRALIENCRELCFHTIGHGPKLARVSLPC